MEYNLKVRFKSQHYFQYKINPDLLKPQNIISHNLTHPDIIQLFTQNDWNCLTN